MRWPRIGGSVLGFFLKSYLAILLLPLLFGSIVVIKSSRIVLDDTIAMNQRILGQAEAAMVRTQTTIDELIAQISYNPRLSALLYRDSIARDQVYSVRSAQRELSTHFVLSDFIEEVYLFASATDLLVTTGTTFLDASRFYHPFYAFPDTRYDEWTDYFAASRRNKQWLPALTMGDGPRSVRVLPYAQSLPIDIPSVNRGFVMVTIREDAVQDLLFPIIAEAGGWAAIQDREGRLLTSVGIAEVHDPVPTSGSERAGSFRMTERRREYVVTHRISPTNGLRFVSVTPARALLKKTQYIRNLALLIDALILVLGAGVALLISRRLSIPLTRLFATAHVDGADGGRFTDALASVDEQFATMEASVERQRPIVEASEFWRLISGQVADLRELSFAGPALAEPHRFYVMVLLQVRREATDLTSGTLKRLALAKAVLRRTLVGRLADCCYVHDVDAASLAVLVCSDHQDVNELRGRVDEVVAQARRISENPYGFEFSCAGSSVKTSIAEAHAAYSEAQEVAEGTAAAIGGKPVFWHAPSLRSTVATYYYPIAEEARITASVKAGDYQAVEASLEAIWERNFADLPATPQTIHLLLTEMLATTIKCARELKLDELAGVAALNRRISECADVGQARGIVERLLETYAALCRIADTRKKSHNRTLCERIVEYIRESFADSSLSLTSVADRFGMSDVYFSSFFKEQSGRNFAELLEEIRMEAALRILGDGATISEIAESVGYNSSNTFRRAFKRRFGVSPSAQKREIVLDS